jgi:hypothetical protein
MEEIYSTSDSQWKEDGNSLDGAAEISCFFSLQTVKETAALFFFFSYFLSQPKYSRRK